MKRRLANKIWKYRLLSIQDHKASKYWRKRWIKYIDATIGIDAKVDRRIYEAMKLSC